MLVLQLFSCKSTSGIDLSGVHTADASATKETKLLYYQIEQMAKKGIAFGHQDATFYGVGWKHEERPQELRSDIKAITGKFPAVQGYDLGHIELGNEQNLDSVSFDLMHDHIQKMNKKGAIISMSWHLDNPVTDGDSWDPTPAVPAILKGGEEREKFEFWINRLSTFFKSLKDKKGRAIPVVFRPFHEMNGSWFWWGGNNVSPEDYKELWRQTHKLLEQNGVHNLLFAYSPNTVGSEEEYEKFYPGDDYVDILGVDIYNHSGNEAFTKQLQDNLQIVRKKAIGADKPFALTETGNVNFGADPEWWTKTLFPGIKNTGISWVLLWRNARPSHYFATYPGEVSEEDFKEFANKEEILFLPAVQKIRSEK